MVLNSKLILLFLFSSILSVSFLTILINQASAQEAQQIIDRRVQIWALFYRGMIAAFVVGAVVQGSIIYVCWRFRESNKKNIPSESAMESARR
jgi:heme/copper-type cytochrome/quinol oxidase subunit 2